MSLALILSLLAIVISGLSISISLGFWTHVHDATTGKEYLQRGRIKIRIL